MDYYGMDAEAISRLPHDNRAGHTITAVVLCMLSATIAVCLRLYTRHFILRRIWLDDYMALAGMIGMISNGILQCIHTRYGLGSHIYDIDSEEKLIQFFKFFYVTTITYNATLMVIKFSLFLQYYRLIQEVPRYRIYYISTMAVVGCWVVAQQFTFIFPCTPIRDYWSFSPDRKCLDSSLIGWMNSIGNILTDVIILALPVPVVVRLNLKREKMWAVLGIFALGFFTCIVSICRMVFFAKVAVDISYDLVPVAAWGEAESASGLICSALIAFGPLLRRFSRRFWPMKKGTDTPQQYSKKHSQKYFNTTNPFSRHTVNRDKSLLRTNGARRPFDGSETELNRMDLERSRKQDAQDDGRSIRSTKSSESMPNLKLNLQTGIRTIITTGNRDSVHSQSLPMAPDGIIVKQVWSVGNRETGSEDDS
ncbi:uncharacterized protein F4812DRAFT_421987 [Daldinia caldariorum]|uniref:uncharacterized protein n=1 Tax=Daldinia caldariorum TaxID=326644 RepID=UPI00200794A0|nr:uncharacterized protein F4812DRAFT_421987 [Daldinia caldariorum]KAI1469084.1 hypothetical protein F4812DRAFT_421987 [Daldinia caldariorum]